jgi:hypothetical protein
LITLNFARRAFGLALLGAAALSQADPIVFDRGLPTANLNNVAGANRSNVGWGDTPSLFVGDDFSITGSGAYNVSSIRTWIVGGNVVGADLSALYSSLTLQLGPGGPNAMTQSFSLFNATRITYGDATTYQSTGGGFRDLWQLDWDTTGLTVNAGDLWNFGVSGVTTAQGVTDLGFANVVFLHSSNAALSGSTQEGADGILGEWVNTTGAFDNNWNSNGNGWDKSSDANVQVFAAPVPEPVTMLVLGGGLLAIARRRRAKK